MYFWRSILATSLLLALPAPASTQETVGTWRLELVIDELDGLPAGAKARRVQGQIAISTISVESAIHFVSDYHRSRLYGRFSLDLIDLYQDIRPRPPDWLLRQANEAFVLEAGDSLEIDLGNGLIMLWGRRNRDNASGTWGLEGNATGTFRMTRIDPDPPMLAVRPMPPPPEPLDTAVRGQVRVRVWDPSAQDYVPMRHGLWSQPSGWRASYQTGTDPQGWGPAFWLLPGEYAVEFSRLPCGNEEWFLAEPVLQRFRIEVGRLTDVTVTIDRRHAAAAKSYNNPTGRRCDK